MVSRQSNPSRLRFEEVFSGAIGLWLALALIKFGNPVIFEETIAPPGNRHELLLAPWPADWGNLILAFLLILGLKFYRWPRSTPLFLIVLPLVWLAWQCLAAFQSIDASLSLLTLKHFLSCVFAYMLGLFAFGQVTRRSGFWIGLIGGFLVVLTVGARQHFGGFEETRQFFFSLPDWASFSDKFLAKVLSDRIYGTLFYPNSFAGVILLMLPIALTVVWRMNRQLRPGLKVAILGLVGLLGLSCLYWSGSKAGWLIALVQAVAFLLHAPWGRRTKLIVIGALLIGGLAGFAMKYQAYFAKGGTSVAARFDYWTAAWQTLNSNPWLGSGPGTFKITYSELKPEGAEMARLAHSDFLQQGSDSGWIGMASYAAWILGALAVLYRRSWKKRWEISTGLWLGLAGVSLQGCVEFGLYIPALAWPTLFLLGWSLTLGEGTAPSQPSAPGAGSGGRRSDQIDVDKDPAAS